MEEKMLYKDPGQPVDVRVEDLLSRMTLEEKAAQLCGDLAASFIVDGKLSHEALKEKFKDGHGRITQYSLVGLVNPKQIAEITNKLQDFFVNETRLGIPLYSQKIFVDTREQAEHSSLHRLMSERHGNRNWQKR